MFKSLLKIFIFILCVLTCFSASCANAAGDIRLYIDGEQIETDVAPIIVNDRTLIPVRCFFEKFDAKVSWVESTKQVVIESSDKSIILKIDDKTAYVNNSAVSLDAAPIIVDDRTLVPVRFISEKLGYSVEWDEKNKTVYITSPEPEMPEVTITGITAVKSGNSSVVTIKADNFQKPSISTAESPLRYILDFEGAVLYGGDSRIKLNNKDITEVRYAQHDGYARVVIESPGKADFTCSYKSGYMTVKVVGEEAEDDKTDNENKSDELVKVDNPVVVIDAGHGGWDSGAIGYDEDGNAVLRECDANLSIALGVKSYLEKNGVKVIMTRTTDKALGSTEMEDLINRSEIANKADATFFVSIHNNAFSDSTASGTMVLYADTDNKINYGVTSKTLAKNILEPLVDSMKLLDRGVVDSPKMVVLRKTDMPSVLIECGFVTCQDDREILMDNERVNDIAYAIAKGILKTISQLP